MKTTLLFRSKFVLCVFLFLISFNGFGQQTLTTINGWNAYVHLPDDYNTTGSQTYPLIVFFPGTGEVGTTASRVIIYGPGNFIASGWKGNVIVNGVTVKPIIISLQPPAVYPQVPAVDLEIETIKTLYRVDPKRISLTGLSMGGWVAEMYAQAHPDKVASVVAIQAVKPDDNPAYPAPFATYARTCGHWLGYEQINDARDMITIYNTMTAAVPGSATYFQTNVGGGGHCCWNTWYDPAHTDSYSLNGVSGNWTIYQYMLTWSGCATGNIAPTVSAGAAQTITLPVNSVNLTGTASGNNGATISSVLWSQVSGTTVTIATPSALSTAITGMNAAGTYTFKLTATDNHTLTSASTVAITVQASAPKLAPTVNAGGSQTIILDSTGTATQPPAPQPAYFNFSSAPVAISGWSNMRGAPSSSVVTASSNGIVLSSVATGNWTPLNGLTSYDGNGMNAPGYFNNANISANNWFQYGDPAANFNAAKPQLQATGLDPALGYTVNLSGSDRLGFDTNPVRFTIIGASNYGSFDVNMDNTADNGAVFNNVYPDASGKLNIYLNSVAGSSTAAEINGIQIIPNATSGLAKSAVSSPTATATLNGTATGNNGATITSTSWSQLSGSATSITNPSSLTTTVTGLIPGQYTYQLTATDNFGMSSNSTVTLTVTTNQSAGTNTGIQVNLFGGQNPYINAAWNNWDVTAAAAGPLTSSAFSYTDGTVSPVTATMSVAQGVGDNGANYGGTVTSPEVLRYASYNSYRRTLTLNNIPAGSLASLEIYGSRAKTGNTSIYTINGVSRSLNTDYDLTTSAVFTNVTVTNGQVQIIIDKTGSFNYINGFRLTFTGTAGMGGGGPGPVTGITNQEILDNSQDKLIVYPNPFDNLVNVKWDNEYTGPATIAIFSMDGKLLYSKNILKDQMEFNDHLILPFKNSGIYLMQIKSQNGKSFMQKIIKR
jgi:pimeloyl-ACP methyl ester carboxylesterase